MSAQTSTHRLVQERELLAQAADVVAKASRAYLLGDRVQETVAASVVLALSPQTLLPPPEGVEVAGPLEFGSEDSRDPAGFLATMIPNNLVERLLDGDATVGLLIPQLLEQLNEIDEPERWSLLEDRPTQAIARLRRDLTDLHIVLSEVRTQGPAQLQALRSAVRHGRGAPLPRAASHVRKALARRLTRQTRQLEQRLAASGFRATAVTRPAELDSPYWPQVETLLLIEAASLHEWYADLEEIAGIIEEELKGQPPFFAAPTREGVLFPSFAVHVIGGKAFPALDQFGDWPELTLPYLQESACLIYRRCVDAISETSAIVASLRPPTTAVESGVAMHDAERDALDSAVARAQDALKEFTEMCKDHAHDQLLLEAHEILTDLGAAAEQEAEARNHGGPQWQGFAAEVMSGMRGVPSDRYLLHLHVTIALSEWDLEPQGALDRVNAGIARVESARADAEGSDDDDA